MTPAPLGVVTQTKSPEREALQYFPADAPVIALVETDPTAPNVRRLVNSGALDELRDFATDQKLRYDQYRELLGNDAVVGQPDIGGPPLAVLIAPDSGSLGSLAESRVRARLARRAGRYRGADFYQADGWAYAVRGPVLLVAGDVKQIVDALDTRVSQDGGFDAERMNAVLPDTTDAVMRAYVDLRPYVEKWLPPAAREIPLLHALSFAGVVVHAEADRLEATLLADTAGTGLTATDLPGTEGSTDVRVVADRRWPSAGVANLGDFALAAERALKSALPVTGLQFDALVARLQNAGIEVTSGLLTGPAYGVVTKRGESLVWRPAAPGAIELALQHAARNYAEPGVRIVRHRDGLYTVTKHGRVVLRIGFVGRRVVAGRAPARELKRLAHAGTERIPGGHAVLRVPKLDRWLPQAVSFALTGTADHVTLRARTEP